MSKWGVNVQRAMDFVNNKAELLEYTMTNLTEAARSIFTDKQEPGLFRAVCLSGVQDQDSNASEKNGYMEIIVRPIYTGVGDCPLPAECAPDPLEYKTADEINKSIALHGNLFMARSNFQFKDHSPIKFGQIVMCKFHRLDPPSDLRFEEPSGIELIQEYLDLAAIEGVAAGSLFEPPGTWPAGMQSIIDGVQSLVQQFGNMFNGDGSGGTSAPGAGAAYEGGNNTEHPRDQGIARGDAHIYGLNYNTHGPRPKMPTHIVIHCTAGRNDYKGTLKSQNKDVSDRLGYNFLIDRNGEFTQCVHPDLAVHHAGGDGNISLQRYGYKLGNYKQAVGVSLCNIAGDAYKLAPGSSKSAKKKNVPKPINLPGFAGYVKAHTLNFNKDTKKMYKSSSVRYHEKYSQAAIDACIKICAVLCLRYGIDPNKIYTHQMMAAKGDPGGTFYPVESEQGIKYDPNLDLFKQKVRQKMATMKGKQLLDNHDRVVAGYMATPEPETPPEGSGGQETPDPNGDGPVDHEGKKIKR